MRTAWELELEGPPVLWGTPAEVLSPPGMVRERYYGLSSVLGLGRGADALAGTWKWKADQENDTCRMRKNAQLYVQQNFELT